MRIDKYLSALEFFPRRKSAPLFKKGFFRVNKTPVLSGAYVLQEGDMISRADQQVIVKLAVTLLIYKPAGYISSDVDEYGRPSYKQLLDNYPYAPLLRIAGRLDVDTEWLIIASSDGQFIHNIISPKRHLPKHYLVTTRDPADQPICEQLAAGVVLDDGYQTQPAQAALIDAHHLKLILTEGKYHQVKRMLEAVGNAVTHLQRTAIGPRTIDDLDGKVYHEISTDILERHR